MRLDLGAIARIWRGGCIIRARFLNRITEAWRADPGLTHLMLAPFFKDVLNRTQQPWRDVVALAVQHGIPVPAFSASLAYYDSLRSARLSANLLQAQRDYSACTPTSASTSRPASGFTPRGPRSSARNRRGRGLPGWNCGRRIFGSAVASVGSTSTYRDPCAQRDPAA